MSSPGSLSRSPLTEASSDELRRLNTLLQGRLAHANAELQRVASSRSVTADEQHRLSRTLLRQTHELRVLEDRYRTRQEEIGRLRAEIAAFQEPEDPNTGVDPRVACLESRLPQQEANFRNLEARFDQAVSERDVLQDQSDHLAEEVRLAGDEIEQLQEDRNDLDRARENAEYELLLTETSLARATEALHQAESQAARPADTSGEASPDLDRLTQERDAARAAATRAADQLGAMKEDLQGYRRSYHESSAELNRLRALQTVSTDDLIRTVRERDTARADADHLRGTVSDLDTKLAAAKETQGIPAKELADAKRRLRDQEHSVRVLQREQDAARDARDQIRRERDEFQRDLDAARQKLAAVPVAMGPTSTVDAGTSGPAAVLHSLRDLPVDPSTPGSTVGPQGRVSLESNSATSPPRPKRSRSSPASSESSPAPPAKRRVAPLSPDSDEDRRSKSSAGKSGSNPVDLTPDGGHLADDNRDLADASDEDSGASPGSHASNDSHSPKDIEAESGSDEEEDEDAAEVANDLLEAQTLQALAQSRSAERRWRQASPRRGPKVAGSGDAPASPRPRLAGSSTPDPMKPVAPFGPEKLCIPGRAQARAMIQREVDSWLADQISDVAMVTMLINVLFPALPTRRGWLFPRITPTARRQYTPRDYCVDLIPEDNVRALLDTRPWEVLERTNDADALSFEEDVGGRHGVAIQRYQTHEPDCLQSYWEATHSFVITPAMVTHHPWLGVYKKERNNRRSHARAHWKAFLESSY
ncbi:hypothetical protein PR003_g20978 [Phytophthora rubi]|uniref:Uncharacterized protein n=1 Tax=Phytophthora rubi TaxID=129364 RepID=A0A6A3P0L3_9STRA|nr:hypothetical protein PR001_g2366 [Phytophthora rubi]KAE9307512.1 hypothetical protein PR003_g20978 [Phytophthora rubi]